MSSLSQNKVTYIQCQQTEVNLFIFTVQMSDREPERCQWIDARHDDQ